VEIVKILLVGHACSPRAGSEPSFTWNWAWHLSQHHQVWVLAYPHDRDFIERFLAEHPNPRLSFCWSDLPPLIASLNPPRNSTGIQSASLYLIWQRQAYRKAIELHREIGFDIVHHVSYASLSAPPPVWKLPVPFIWGPIGGAQQTPTSFRRYISHGWAREFLRNIRVRLFSYSPTLRKAVRSSAALLATNRDTAQLLRKLGGQDVRLFLDSGVTSNFILREPISKPRDSSFTLLWAGRMQPRKALPLALEALARTKELQVKLLIAGEGEMRRSWEQCAKRLNLSGRVKFLGRVPWEEMPRLYQSGDAFLFTSLRDSFGTQVLEAMGHGLPILTLDHQGVGTFVPREAGIKVPVASREQTLAGLAEGIRRLVLFPEERRKMGAAAHAFARTQTWERRAERMSNLYDEVLSRPMNHQKRDRFTAPAASARLGGPASYGSYAINKRMEKIDETLNLKDMRVLDLGCGNGCYTEELARRAEFVCGIDLHMPHLQVFRENIPRVQGAGEHLPFASESFDAVTMIEVLEHTNCDTKVLAECFRVLKPGGLLVLFVPNKFYPFESHPCRLGTISLGRNVPLVSWLPESLRRHMCYARIYTRRALFAMARNIGFQIRKSGFIFPPLDLFPLPFKDRYRRIASRLEDSPLGSLGVSIYAVLAKPLLLAQTVPLQPNQERYENATFDVLGVRTHAVQMREVVDRMREWIRERGECHSIAATSMHGIVEAQNDPTFKEILNATDLVVPDGMPLVWLGRRKGHRLRRRVYGPELLLSFCERRIEQGYRHFFLGGEPGVAERLSESLKTRFPGLNVVGTCSPPFRPLNVAEDEEMVDLINRAAPDVLWVGLGAPKQERWMHEHKSRLRVPVVVGVGAAFDMLSGRRRQAPLWMREHGLEWLFRLMQEPRRLWRRYLVYGTQFITYVALERLRTRNFETVDAQASNHVSPREART
jgi:exopolysaccharide biosynthesis WecB/TagA/CpsF family protein